jgi:hypothetical protein
MHPEFLRQMIQQRDLELRARAEHNRLVRQFIQNIRQQRRNSTVANREAAQVVTAVPDFVDGSFIESAAAEAKNAAGRVPAARNAA